MTPAEFESLTPDSGYIRPIMPGDRVFFRYSERCTYPALIQSFNADGSARLWVLAVMSIYCHECGEGALIGQYSREYTEPSTTLKDLPEYR